MQLPASGDVHLQALTVVRRPKRRAEAMADSDDAVDAAATLREQHILEVQTPATPDALLDRKDRLNQVLARADAGLQQSILNECMAILQSHPFDAQATMAVGQALSWASECCHLGATRRWVKYASHAICDRVQPETAPPAPTTNAGLMDLMQIFMFVVSGADLSLYEHDRVYPDPVDCPKWTEQALQSMTFGGRPMQALERAIQSSTGEAQAWMQALWNRIVCQLCRRAGAQAVQDLLRGRPVSVRVGVTQPPPLHWQILARDWLLGPRYIFELLCSLPHAQLPRILRSLIARLTPHADAMGAGFYGGMLSQVVLLCEASAQPGLERQLGRLRQRARAALQPRP